MSMLPCDTGKYMQNSFASIPKPFRERFGEGMEQTFNDLCQKRKEAGKGLFAFALWAFVKTSAGMFRLPYKGLLAVAW